jgi:cell fate (sporulation/competence/biofilm development) regulator YlbF (YheA/YmcA/DUF963 family)
MNINEGSIGLVEAIKATTEYLRLKQLKAVISKNPNLRKEIEEFNLSQKQLYSAKGMPSKESEARIQQLKTKFDNLSKIPEVDNYLRASNDFNQLVSKIYKNIDENLEKGLN